MSALAHACCASSVSSLESCRVEEHGDNIHEKRKAGFGQSKGQSITYLKLE